MAGCYAHMNGYRVIIFELHDLPGGLCTAWERKGYVFDGCIHYLFGSGEGQPFHAMWQELGAKQDRPMIDHDEYQRITDGEHTLIVYTDPDKLQAHMTEISPADAGLIRQFCDGVRQFTRFDMSAMYRKPRPLTNGLDWRDFGMAMLPVRCLPPSIHPEAHAPAVLTVALRPVNQFIVHRAQTVLAGKRSPEAGPHQA